MKTILFRFSVALSAFLLGLGCFAGWTFLFKSNQLAKIEITEWQNFSPEIVAPISKPEKDETILTSDEKPTFEDGGYFYIIGNKPKSFKELKYFELHFWDYDEKKGELIVPDGSVYSKYPYQFRKVFIGKQDISFETEKFKGTSFQFIGKLVDKVYEVEDDSVYLEGTLIKFQNGKKIAEKRFKFGWTLGC